MINLRFHGFGGQGVVTMAEIAALAASLSGYQACSFPFFGPERIGAPVEAYVRLDSQPIRTRSITLVPDWIVVADDKLLADIQVLSGSRRSTRLLVASHKTWAELKQLPTLKRWPDKQLLVIDTGLIASAAGERRSANAALLGALAAYSGLFGPDNLTQAIEQKLTDKGAAIIASNREAAYLGYEETTQ